MREFWHSDVAPGPSRGSSPGTFCRKSLPCPAGPSRGGRLPAASRFRPSQWREGAGTCARLSGEWVLCVALTAASDGRLNSASSLVVPSPFPLRGAHCGPRCPARGPGHRPGRGFPRRPGVSPRPSPRRRRASGTGLRERTWGLGSTGCRPPIPGRLGFSPARSRRPFHRGLLRVGVRVGLLVPKAAERLFKLEAGFAPTARSAVAETESWGLLASESIQRPVPVQPQVPKPRRCASTPPRLIELAPSGTSRDGRVTSVVQVSARHMGRSRSVQCAADGDRARRVLPRTAVGVAVPFTCQTALVRCAKRRAGPNSGTSTR